MSAKPTTAISELSPTDRNLWQAIVSEALAHLTYTAYAHKAMEDGFTRGSAGIPGGCRR